MCPYLLRGEGYLPTERIIIYQLILPNRGWIFVVGKESISPQGKQEKKHTPVSF
jgi:hypothetical protein